ncbi:MAG: CBS domain-containing protein [Planctomycetes bacterium]|nr:CBS domain-containing protein [Planctomycetota bacterium]
MLVQDALVPNPLVVTPDTTVLDFCKQVLASNQTTACVVAGDDHKLLGMVSVHDVFQRILPAYLGKKDNLASVIHEGYFEERFDELRRTPVSDLMSKDIHVLAPHDSVIKAISLFSSATHKTAPVVRDGKFIGTITRRSVLQKVTESA